MEKEKGKGSWVSWLAVLFALGALAPVAAVWIKVQGEFASLTKALANSTLAPGTAGCACLVPPQGGDPVALFLVRVGEMPPIAALLGVGSIIISAIAYGLNQRRKRVGLLGAMVGACVVAFYLLARLAFGGT